MTLGRVAIVSRAVPFIVPVDACIDGDVVFVRTSGRRFAAATDNAVVAFEADAIDDTGAWSVSVAGTATTAADSDVRRVEARLPRWIVPTADRVVAISTDLMIGWRIPRPATA